MVCPSWRREPGPGGGVGPSEVCEVSVSICPGSSTPATPTSLRRRHPTVRAGRPVGTVVPAVSDRRPDPGAVVGDFAGRLKVVKVNVDVSRQVAQRYDARSIPMLLFIRDGEVVDTVVGAQPEHVMRSLIERYV